MTTPNLLTPDELAQLVHQNWYAVETERNIEATRAVLDVLYQEGDFQGVLQWVMSLDDEDELTELFDVLTERQDELSEIADEEND